MKNELLLQVFVLFTLHVVGEISVAWIYRLPCTYIFAYVLKQVDLQLTFLVSSVNFSHMNNLQGRLLGHAELPHPGAVPHDLPHGGQVRRGGHLGPTVGSQNFGKMLLVFGCIGSDFCRKICVLQHFSKSTRFSS